MNREWRLANPEKVHAIQKRHRDAYPGRVAAAARAARAANPDRFHERDRRWYAKNKDAMRAQAKINNADRVMIAGDRVRIGQLPPELQPIAQLIKEARKTLREKATHGNS
jgi:hypothetical protein